MRLGVAWSARPDGSADFLNQTYLDYTGLKAEDGMDWGWTAAVHPDDLNGLLAEWQRWGRILGRPLLTAGKLRVREREAERVIVGLPLTLRGDEGEHAP